MGDLCNSLGYRNWLDLIQEGRPRVRIAEYAKALVLKKMLPEVDSPDLRLNQACMKCGGEMEWRRQIASALNNARI